MNEQSLIEQVKQHARLNNVDPALACAVVEQESAWNVWAIRYEPGFYMRYVVHQVNLNETERSARATSWGVFQMMGQVARELGFEQKFLSSLCDPDFGIPLGIKKLKQCLEACGGDEAKALLRWNGGGNAEYPLQVLARKEKYQ